MKRYVKSNIDWDYVNSIMPIVKSCGRAGGPDSTGIKVKVKNPTTSESTGTGVIVGGWSDGTPEGTNFRIRFISPRGYAYGYSESTYNINDIVFLR